MKPSERANQIIIKCVKSQYGEILVDRSKTSRVLINEQWIPTPTDTILADKENNESAISELLNAGLIVESPLTNEAKGISYKYTPKGWDYVMGMTNIPN